MHSNGRQMLVGVPVSLVANAAVIFAVVQSPYGSLGFFDDSPSTSDWLLPMASGAAIGLLEALAFRARTTLIADGLTVLLGLISFLFIFPVANYAIGCALGAGVATAVSRWMRDRLSGLAPIFLLSGVSLAAVGYGVIDHTPEPLPLLNVLRTADGPAVLVDQLERIKSAEAVGTLADVDGCLGLVDASVDGGTDGSTVLVVWRLGTSVSSDPFRLTVDGRTYGLGDKVTVPGAGLLTLKRDLEAYRPDMPASCAGHDVFL